jgi:VWFA-related protein
MIAGSGGHAQTPPQQGPPTFRGRVDIARTTVRVLDANRQPIRGLTDKDFTVFVNGVSQPIVAVVADDEPGPVVPSAPWMRDVSPDVASNDLVDPRLIVIIMDDATPGLRAGPAIARTIPSLENSKSGAYQQQQMRRVTQAIVDELGPRDLASIVYSADNRGPQDFTQDRSKLVAAVNRYHPTELDPVLVGEYKRNVIQMSLEFLRQAPEHRSVIFWVSDAFLGPDPDILPLSVPPAPGTTKANVSIPTGSTSVPVYTISTRGFTGGVVPQDGTDTLPGMTGGASIGQTNTPAAEVPGLFQELSVAYTIGFQTPAQSDGRFRRVQVRVNRPGALILPAELGYFPPNAKDLAKAASATKVGTPTTLALSGIVPVSDEPLRLAVAPFAGGDARNPSLARVAVALGLDLPFAGGGVGDTVDLEMRLFDAEGRKQIDERHVTQTVRGRSGRDRGEVEMLSTLSLKPGRYNIRAAMHSQLGEGVGSVYADFVVPDFEHAPISLSGIVVSTVPDKPAMPAGEFTAWLPGNPTTTREFGQRDRVSVFVRAYAKADTAPESIAIGAEIRDAHDQVVFTKTDALPFAGGASPKGADYRLRLPLDTLASGEYLLTITAKGTAEVEARRDVRFSIR